jgi:hypothetical protein
MKDNKYANGKIYLVRSLLEPNLGYIGSTVRRLNTRLRDHRIGAQNPYFQSRFFTTMRAHGVEQWSIELLENYPCTSLQELEEREFEWIQHQVQEGYTGNLLNTNLRRPQGCIQHKPLSTCYVVRWYEDGDQLSKCFSYGSRSTRDQEAALVEAELYRRSILDKN